MGLFVALRLLPPPNRSPKISPKISPIIRAVKVKSAESAISAGSAAVFKGCMAELIVGFSFFRIAEHTVGLGGFFEFLLSVLISRIHIRMILFRQLSVCFFQGRIISSPVDTENLVIISFFCHYLHLSCRRPANTAPSGETPDSHLFNRTAKGVSPLSDHRDTLVIAQLQGRRHFRIPAPEGFPLRPGDFPSAAFLRNLYTSL